VFTYPPSERTLFACTDILGPSILDVRALGSKFVCEGVNAKG